MKIVNVETLKAFSSSLLAKSGFTDEEAAAIAASLTLSEMTGHSSHGLTRMRGYIKDLRKGSTVSGVKPQTIQETANSIMVDGQHGTGPIVIPPLLNKLRAKLDDNAVVCATLLNCGNVGRLGEWVEIVAKAGYPGLMLVNDNGGFFCVAPPGGKKAVTSTNPLAFAIPLPEGEVFLTDMSSSSIAYGKVRLAYLEGTSVSPYCIKDADGKMTLDPGVLFSFPSGSIMPMGGGQEHKGFALSMFIDMLVAGLSGGYAPPAPSGVKVANNSVFVFWNPRFFAGLDHIQSQARKYIDFVRSSSPADPTRPLRLAGDRMRTLQQERERDGVPLSTALTADLLALARELDVAPPPALIHENTGSTTTKAISAACIPR
ncbi:MAG: Ldh family oxidoreductase [Alphaproteobacteria bacterium]|nr:Ldh family oxidoreductase [Alphaproteobacteria bacterium]